MFSTFLHMLIIHNLPTVFQNGVCRSTGAWTKFISHSRNKDKSLSLVSLEGSKQQNNSMRSQVLGSPLAQCLFCKGCIKREQTYSNPLITDTGLGTFPQLLRNIKGRGEGEQSEMGCCQISLESHLHVRNLPQASAPYINIDPAGPLTFSLFPFCLPLIHCFHSWYDQ